MILVTASLKGGCGKTTSAVFIGQALALLGKRVLLIDLDHNNNLTDYFLRSVESEILESRNIYHVLKSNKKISDCVFTTEFNVDVIPATPALSRIESEMIRDPGVLLRFPAILRRLEYDYIVLDTPPSICFALSAALYSADIVLCPVSWGRWTIQGYTLLAEECSRVSEGTGVPMKIFALPSIVTEVEDAKLREVDSWEMTKTTISKTVSVKNSGSGGRSLKTDTKSWGEFLRLAGEFINE